MTNGHKDPWVIFDEMARSIEAEVRNALRTRDTELQWQPVTAAAVVQDGEVISPEAWISGSNILIGYSATDDGGDLYNVIFTDRPFHFTDDLPVKSLAVRLAKAAIPFERGARQSEGIS